MATTLLRPYTTLEEVQRETKNSGTELDDWYRDCINLASRYIEERCKRDFWFHDYTGSEYRVRRSRVLEDKVVLPFPIISLTQVRVFSDILDPSDANDIWKTDEYYYEVGEPTIHTEAETDWKFTGAPGRFGSYPFRGFLWIKGEFGYPLDAASDVTPSQVPPPTIPANVRRACTLIAAAVSDEMHKETVGLDGSRIELLETRVPREVHPMLERYKDHFETNF